MTHKFARLLTLIAILLLLVACSRADNKPPPTNTPSIEDRLTARHKEEFDILRPNCFQADTTKVGTEMSAANQALLRAMMNLLSDPLAQELSLDTLAAIHRELSGRRSQFYRGDDDFILVALGQGWCNVLTSHPNSSFLVYVVNRVGMVWPVGQIGSVQNEDVHWTGDGWVMIPDTIGSPNPYNNKFAVWHIEKRADEWTSYKFEPEAQYIADVPGPKVVASRLKPEWRSIEGRDEVIFEFTLLTGSPPCENLLEKKLTVLSDSVVHVFEPTLPPSNSPQQKDNLNISPPLEGPRSQPPNSQELEEFFYQTHREIRVMYQRRDGVYVKVDEELLSESVAGVDVQMSLIFTKCSDGVSNTGANAGMTDTQN